MIPLRIEDTVLLEDFGDDWNGRVDRVRNHENEGLRAGQGDPGSKITNDASVDLISKRVSVSASTERDGWTYLKQIISEIVVDVSVVIVIMGNHANLVIWQVSGNQRVLGTQIEISLTPGFLGTPAGMITRSAPVKAFLRPSSGGRYPSTFDWVLMWERSEATPGVLTISYKPSYLGKVRAEQCVLDLLGYFGD